MKKPWSSLGNKRVARLKALVTYTFCRALCIFLTQHLSQSIPPTFPSLLGACRGSGGLLYSAGAPGPDTPVGGTPSPARWTPAPADPLCTKFIALPESKAGVSTHAYPLPWLVISEVLLVHSFRNESIVCLLRVLVTWVTGEPRGMLPLNMWSSWYFKYLASMTVSRSL